MQDFAHPLTVGDRMTLRHFRKYLPKTEHKQFDTLVYDLLRAERDFALDRVTHGHLVFGSCVLASTQCWQQMGETRSAAKSLVRGAVISTGRKSTAVIVAIVCFFAKDSFETMRKHSVDKSEQAYGPSFDIRTRDMDDGFVSEVRVCGYCAFLARHDASDLIDLFCEWDRVWIDALPKSILFSRPTTIGQGGESCRFEFRRGANSS